MALHGTAILIERRLWKNLACTAPLKSTLPASVALMVGILKIILITHESERMYLTCYGSCTIGVGHICIVPANFGCGFKREGMSAEAFQALHVVFHVSTSDVAGQTGASGADTTAA